MKVYIIFVFCQSMVR